MFHPENKLRTSWDFFVLAVTVLGAIQMPLPVVFDLSSFPAVSAVLWIIPAVFIADILVQFNTGFYRLGKTITKGSSVALRYLKSWFVLDLLAARQLQPLNTPAPLEDASRAHQMLEQGGHTGKIVLLTDAYTGTAKPTPP